MNYINFITIGMLLSAPVTNMVILYTIDMKKDNYALYEHYKNGRYTYSDIKQHSNSTYDQKKEC